MADAVLGHIPVYNSWAVQEGTLVSSEGPVLWAHPRTVAAIAHPGDPVAQLRAVVAVLIRDAGRLFDRAIERLTVGDGSSSNTERSEQ